jgi:hypothetical protein
MTGGTEEETSVHVLCACEALTSIRHSFLGSCFLDPEDIRTVNIGAIWKLAKETGFLLFIDRTWGTKDLS